MSSTLALLAILVLAIPSLVVISGHLIAGDDGYGGVLRESYLILATAVGIGAVGATLHFVAYKGARWLWGVAALRCGC